MYSLVELTGLQWNHTVFKKLSCSHGSYIRLSREVPSTWQGQAFLRLPLLVLLPLAAGQAVINFHILTGRQNASVLGLRRVPPAYILDSRD